MKKHLLITLALLLTLSMLGCSGTRISGLPDENAAPKMSTDIPGTVLYTTELIAGAGGWNPGNGGWPAHGTDVGEVVVSYTGTTLHVTYVLASGYSFGSGVVVDPDGNETYSESLHLWVGTSAPVYSPGGLPAPGKFKDNGGYQAAPPAGATEYTFNLPGMYTGVPLWIMAHGVICSPSGESGYVYTSDSVTLWAGQTINSGYATITVVEEDGVEYLYIAIIPQDDWVIAQDHLWVGFNPNDPDYGIPYNNQGNPPPGQFPYSNPNPPYPRASDFFKVPLADIPHWGEEGYGWDGDVLHLCIALHVVVQKGYYDEGEWVVTEEQTAWGWDQNPNHDFPGKRWGGWYCFNITRTWVSGGEGVCETAWGFELDGARPNGDGTSQNEPGWFPTFFGVNPNNGKPQVHRWGWVIYLGAGAG